MEGEGEVATGRRVLCKTKHGNEKEKERGGKEMEMERGGKRRGGRRRRRRGATMLTRVWEGMELKSKGRSRGGMENKRETRITIQKQGQVIGG